MPTVHETGEKVFAAVLAAGQSRRFGSPKQVQDWNGVPLVQHALDIAIGACGQNTLLVLGHAHESVMFAAPDAPFVVYNDYYKQGMGTSIAAASRALAGVADAVIIMPADQPMVSSAHLRALIEEWTGDPERIVATRYAGIDGTPTLFPRGTFASLSAMRSHRGARELLSDDRFQVQSVACEEAAFDIDTPADLEQRSQFTQPESPST